MSSEDLASGAREALAHLQRHGDEDRARAYLAILDDLATGLTDHAALVAKHGSADAIASALYYPTKAIHGGGACPPIAEGGWYENAGARYRVAPGFAQAWAQLRGLSRPAEGRGETSSPRPATWLVGAFYRRRGEDQTDRFVADGIWENGYEDRYLDEVRAMKPGDRIAIKATYTRKHDLPFDNRGETVSVMAIKAVGVITENPGDGRRVRVSWTRLPEPREWYFYTFRKTVTRIAGGKWMSEALIAFIDGALQDIPRFLADPFWAGRYGGAPDRFAWTTFYRAFAEALRGWRNRRAELVAHVHAVAAELDGEGIGHLRDHFPDGTQGPLEDICPFTVMTLFNRRLKDENRTRIAAALAARLGVDVPAPTSFDGLPVFMPLKSWFFGYADARGAEDIDRLWEAFDAALAAVEPAPDLEAQEGRSEDAEARFIAAHDAVYKQKGVRTNLSTGLYYAVPERYVSLDGPMRAQLTALGVPLALDKTSRMTGRDYLALCDAIETRLRDGTLPVASLPALSYRAFTETQQAGEIPVVEDADDVEDAPAAGEPSVAPAPVLPPYDLDALLAEDCFLPRARLDTMLGALHETKNIVLQGPPGTGKTWLAKRLAYALVGAKDAEAVEVVQFHPTLSYEDFVRGWRPAGEGRLALVDGVLLQAAARARAAGGRPVVLVIEEINRGNPAQAFGEMLTLIEATMRETPMRLAYMREGEAPFALPKNLFLIGTMNVADRSLALVDLALRRRFAFFDLEPSLNGAWKAHCLARGMPETFADLVAARLAALNDTISGERALGPNFRVGHSYVTPRHDTPTDWGVWFRRRVETQIAPLLQEYWFDAPEKAASESARLLADLPS